MRLSLQPPTESGHSINGTKLGQLSNSVTADNDVKATLVQSRDTVQLQAQGLPADHSTACNSAASIVLPPLLSSSAVVSYNLVPKKQSVHGPPSLPKEVLPDIKRSSKTASSAVQPLKSKQVEQLRDKPRSNAADLLALPSRYKVPPSRSREVSVRHARLSQPTCSAAHPLSSKHNNAKENNSVLSSRSHSANSAASTNSGLSGRAWRSSTAAKDNSRRKPTSADNPSGHRRFAAAAHRKDRDSAINSRHRSVSRDRFATKSSESVYAKSHRRVSSDGDSSHSTPRRHPC